MDNSSFWGDTPSCNIYDLSVLLTMPHEYMYIDKDSKAYQLLHELFMATSCFDTD